MYYRLGQAFARPFAAYAYPNKRRVAYAPLSLSLLNELRQNVDISQTLNYTVTIREFITQEVLTNQYITLDTDAEIIDDIIEVIQNIDLRVIKREVISQNVNVSQIITPIDGTEHVISNEITVSDAIYIHSDDTSTDITGNLNVDQNITNIKKLSIRKLTTTLNLISNFIHDLTYTEEDTLSVKSDFISGITTNKSLIDNLSLLSEFSATLLVSIEHPVVTGVNYIYDDLVILESQYVGLVLPTPEFNDSQKHNDSIEVKRTMSSAYRSYIKRSRTEILTYTWLLDYDKAAEFKEWVKINLTEKIKLTNWKGEIWLGDIISEDFSLRAETKYQGKARQKTSVTIQFEGVKIHG